MSNSNSRTDLRKIELGNKVTEISPKCFTACYNLSSAVISANVTVIGRDAFLGAKSLSSVTFDGRTASEVAALIPNIADIGITQVGVAKDKDGNAIDPSIIMKAVYEDGTEVQRGIASDGLKRSIVTSLDYKNLESLDLGTLSTDIQDGCFLDCDKLTEVILDEMEAETVASKVADWDLGINNEGDTHLVAVYCKDGVVVVNDADSSSGEMGLRIDWDKFAEVLEDYPNMTALPAIGTSLIVPYKVDPDGDAVDTEWEIIGYNTSIPQYVKYMNGNTRIYVSSVKNGLLSAITAGDVTYVKNSDGSYTADGNSVAAIGSETFTYGNNCTYSVPKSITVNGTSYTFAGYNCNLLSKYTLATKYNGTLYHYPQFRSYQKSSQFRNDWSDSELREWMNGSTAVNTQKWYDLTWSNPTTGTIVGMTGRLTDTKFMLHAMPTVNRTWVYSSWTSGKTLDGNSCEHVVDKFWTLGIGNINCTGKVSGTEYFKDTNYDTSKFSTMFNQVDLETSEKSHVRRSMKEDGSKGKLCFWWLRSSDSDHRSSSGYINAGGIVFRGQSYNYYGVLPACTIC